MTKRKRFNVPVRQAEAVFVLMGCSCTHGPDRMAIYVPPHLALSISVRHGCVHPTTLSRLTRQVAEYLEGAQA